MLNTMRVLGWLIALVISFLFNSFLRSLAQQNKTRHQLYESKYRFTQVFNSAPQGMALINRSGVVIDLNDSLCNTLGYSHSELQQQNFFTYVVPD